MENELSSADNCDDVVPDKTKDTHWKRKLELIEDIKKTVDSGKTN